MHEYLKLDEYLMSLPGATCDFKEEWQWHRYMVGGKMFAAICHPGDDHKAPYSGHDLINLKCDPTASELLRDTYPDIHPGFYMDKRNWIAAFLDGGLPEDLVFELSKQSYELVFGKLTKKLQREILG